MGIESRCSGAGGRTPALFAFAVTCGQRRSDRMAKLSGLKRYNPRKRRHEEKMAAMRQGLICWVLLVGCALAGFRTSAAQILNPWEKPASNLADQIVGIVGPGQVQLTIRNISTIPAGDLPAIRKLI